MNDGISILVAVFLILIALRWMLGRQPQNPQQRQRRTPARRTHRVTPQMIEMVRAMFPDIPVAAIQADLQRTGSVETTVDNALRDGGLPMPAIPTPPSQPGSPSLNNTSSSSSRKTTNHGSLLQRYKIDSQSLNEEKLEEPPRVWEASAEKRQEMLKKRKEFMVLQARKKLLEKQQETKPINDENTTSTSPIVNGIANDNNNDDNNDKSNDNIDIATSSASKSDGLSVDELNALSPEERRRHMLQAFEKKQTT
ncbi:unnamed protein product [Cunninghamella blakesleeana]